MKNVNAEKTNNKMGGMGEPSGGLFEGSNKTNNSNHPKPGKNKADLTSLENTEDERLGIKKNKLNSFLEPSMSDIEIDGLTEGCGDDDELYEELEIDENALREALNESDTEELETNDMALEGLSLENTENNIANTVSEEFEKELQEQVKDSLIQTLSEEYDQLDDSLTEKFIPKDAKDAARDDAYNKMKSRRFRRVKSPKSKRISQKTTTASSF